MLALVLAAAALAKPLPPFEPVKRRPLAPPPTPPRVERPPSPEDLAREAWAAAPPRRAACANATRSATTREATSWRRRGQRETGARFDPLSTVQCGLERCRAAWGAAAGTRVSAKHEARPGPPHGAEIEVRLGGGVAYVAMPKAGSKTVEKTLARSNVSAPAANFAAFHRATLSPTPPFVFTFVRSPASHYASGLGQAQMHFYGPARECYAYGHKCMQGTPPYQIARKNRLKAEAEGTAVAPRRVSKWLSAATYESGGGGPAAKRNLGRFRNRHTDPMTRRLLFSDIVYDFIGRLEHLESDWRALQEALLKRGLPPLGDLAVVGRSEAPPEPEARRNDRFLLLEPPVPASASAADVRHLCRMIAPDLACLADVYVAPSLCRRPLVEGDWDNASAAGGLWDLWIKNK